VVPRRRRLKLAANLHAARVVQLAEQPQDTIGYAFVNPWNSDYKVPAQVIILQYYYQLSFENMKRKQSDNI
jgi:hypothetical protein